jgi:hypothetical protein
MNVFTWHQALLLASLATPLHLWAQDCALSLSPSNIDLGQLNRTTLPTFPSELAPRQLALNLLCESAHDLSLIYRARHTLAQGFTLGDGAGYRLKVVQSSVDGQAVQWGHVPTGTQAFSSHGGIGHLEPDIALQPVREGAVVRGRRLSAQLELTASFATSVRDAAQAQTWLASGSLELVGQQRRLQVQGTYAPAACRPTLSSAGQVDFGRIGLNELNRDKPTLLGRQTSLNVECDAATRFAVRAVDNRMGTASDALPLPAASLFGIGRNATGQPLGGFSIRLGTAVERNGNTASTLRGDPAAQLWRPDPDQLLRHDATITAWQSSQSAGLAPEAWTALAIPLTIDLYLRPTRQLDVGQETAIDGSATLEIIYL